MKTILVTGASGFIGQQLIPILAEIGHKVRASIRTKTDNITAYETISVGDIGPVTEWGNALHNVECVIHLAARVHVMKETLIDPLSEFRKVNSDGTLNLARQAVKAGVTRFIYISSIKVNGEQTFNDVPYTANTKPAPIDAYAISKLEAELALNVLSKETGMEVVIIRPPLVYGPGVKANFLKMLQLLNSGIPLPLGAINNSRSMVGLDNLIDFIILCIDHPNASNQIFLVSDDDDQSTTSILKILARAINAPIRLLPVPESVLRLGSYIIGKPDIFRRLCGSLQVDISKNNDLLGWSPPNTFEHSIKQVADYFLTQSIK